MLQNNEAPRRRGEQTNSTWPDILRDVTAACGLGPADIRPCISGMTGLEGHDRSFATQEIASELMRIGLPKSVILSVLGAWNRGNHPPIEATRLHAEVSRVRELPVAPNCDQIGDWCPGRDACPFGRWIDRLDADMEEIARRHPYLSPLEVRVYDAIGHFELLQGSGPGAAVALSLTDLATTFVDMPSFAIDRALTCLSAFGLIRCEAPETGPNGVPTHGRVVQLVRPIPGPIRPTIDNEAWYVRLALCAGHDPWPILDPL